MDWKEFAPYAVPLLVMALLARRAMKSQRPTIVRLERLWVFPAILLILVGLTLSRETTPSLVWIVAFALVAAAGCAFGWFRVHTLEFSVDPETGTVSSKATAFGAILLVALLLFRYAMKDFLNDAGVRGAELARWTDGALIFSTAMLIAQSAHTWVRARRLTSPSLTGAEPAGSRATPD